MIVWIFPALITTVLSINQMCPGGSYSCPDDATCCQLLDKTYGCCPLKNAVCCDDHIHCCPQNSKCESGICVQLNNLNATAHKLTIKNNNNTCSDTRFVCPDESTCCRGSEPGTYGCCPMEDAVCCEDGTHCCPEGTVCDLQEERCIGEGFITEMYDSQKTKIQFKSVKYSSLEKSVNYSNIICPGGSFQCPSRDTCCQLPNGDWGCCPFQNAKCCNDHLHCCPEYMQCDSKSQSCFQGSKKIPSVVKKPSKPIDVSVTCPDNTTCAESMTCCKINHMHYGCCLYPNAVCCRDLLHCCPSDYICDDIGKQCIPKKKKNA